MKLDSNQSRVALVVEDWKRIILMPISLLVFHLSKNSQLPSLDFTSFSLPGSERIVDLEFTKDLDSSVVILLSGRKQIMIFDENSQPYKHNFDFEIIKCNFTSLFL